MKVLISEKLCNGDGICADICPELFRMNTGSIAEVTVNPIPQKYQEVCREVAQICPESCIYIEN